MTQNNIYNEINNMSTNPLVFYDENETENITCDKSMVYVESNISDKSMVCEACCSTILSNKHADKCCTINMYQIKESILDNNFKPMMTYGLGSCTAFIMINKNTKKIIFAHHPDYQIIKLFFNINYNSSDNFICILKVPGSYVKEIGEDFWKLKSINESVQKKDFSKPNVEQNIVPYCLSNQFNDRYNSTLYCKYSNNKFTYTDSNGRYNHIDL